MTIRFSINIKLIFFMSLIILFKISSSLYASDEETFTRRFVWRGDENVWRYSVEIQISENRSFRSLRQEYTTTPYLVVSLPAGDYRFRIIPHDILDRPRDATQWVRFSIRSAPKQAAGSSRNRRGASGGDSGGSEQIIEVINFEQITGDNDRPAVENEQSTESDETRNSARYRFTTVGISAGTAFTDPLVILTLHGTYAPANNFFIELGCDIGFISAYNDVESFYSFYPFINFYYFLPFKNKGGFFAGGGAGYIIGSYQFSHGGKADLRLFAANTTVGINIADVVNISHIFKVGFTGVSHQIAIGYVYRFKQRR